MLKAVTNLVNVSQITGVLPVVNGGTGVTTSTGTGNTVLSAAPTLSGNVTLSTGNLIVASGQGIDFSATSGTGDSELFDDYERGSFTPTMTSATGTVTVNTGNGRYAKIGNKVFVAMKIDYTTNALVATSNITFGALPFTSGSTYYFKSLVVESNWTSSDINDGNLVGNLSATTITWANRLVSQSSRTNAIVWVVADYFAA
jgi:hypothetical protein